MNPSTMLKNTGRAIAYRPNLARLFGGVIAEIFFEQIFYWQDKRERNCSKIPALKWRPKPNQ